MAKHIIKTHQAVCKVCGKKFEEPNNCHLSVCPDCRLYGATCLVCGKKIPWDKKFCSRSCNSKHNMLVSNPMSNPASRKKLSDSMHTRYGEQWEASKLKREQDRQEWLSHAKEREAIRVAKWKKSVANSHTLMGLANPKAKEKALATALTKNGGMGLASSAAKEKAHQTNLAKYRVENPAKSLAVRQVISEKARAFRNNPSVKQKAINTLQQRYGVSNAFLVGAENRLPSFNSAAEEEIASFIESLGVKVIRHNHSLLGNRELDIYCPDYAVAVEYNGMYWHSKDVVSSKFYHYEKTIQCEQKGVRLIHIYEWEWLNPVKQQIIKSLLTVIFGKVNKPIYARQCEIRDVSLSEYRKFCEDNHLQGYRYAKVIYGLYYKGVLQQLMSFNPPQKRNAKVTFEWEIVRGCPGSNNVVVGGVSRLWKHFLKEQNPTSVMSYCDINKFDGHSYLDIGMSLYKTDPANVWYIQKNTGKVTQWLYRDKQRRENQLKTSFVVYGAGNKTFVWNK